MTNSTSTNQRPTGVTVASLLFGWLAIAGFGNAVVWNQPQILAAQPQLVLTLGGTFFTVAAVAYGVTALATCIGLWRMKSWALRAYLAWSAAALTLALLFALSGFAASTFIGVLFAVALVPLLMLGYKFLARRVT